jgi:hypothetical protein
VAKGAQKVQECIIKAYHRALSFSDGGEHIVHQNFFSLLVA